MLCSICNFDKSEFDEVSGTTVCMSCGIVLEESTLVSEITFQETSGGHSIAQGSFVSESGRVSGRSKFGKKVESQDQAIENGQQNIASLAHATRLPERYRETAQRYYKLAVVNRFTRGRETEHVAAACLYVVCRMEKSSKMLIDFAQVLQVNVFTLGGVFLKLCNELSIVLPVMDPCIYIARFAAALDFGDYTHRVAEDAVRIVQRMDREWIVSGRMPAGICGASLLIAARMNGFRRTVSEMIYIVKVGDVTIKNRLREFNKTESANLSLRDFRATWLETSANPPSYAKNTKKQQAEQKRTSTKRSNKGDGEAAPQRKKRRSNKTNKTTISDGITIDGSRIHIQSNLSSSKRKRDMQDDGDLQLDQDEEVAEAEMIQGRMNAILNKHIRKAKKQRHDAVNEANKENIPLQVGGKATQRNNNKSPAGVNLVNEADEDESDDEFFDAEDDEDVFEDAEDGQDGQDGQDIPTQVEYSNVAGYKSLPKNVQKEIESTARQTVALEEKALLDPELNDEALKLSNEMENWMDNNSVIRAAEEIENEKRSLSKPNNANDGNVLGDQRAIETPNTSTDQPQRQAIRDDDDLSDADDAEVEAMILTPEEVRLKTQVWYNTNKTYLEEMAIKRMVEKDKGINPVSRKGKNNKKKIVQPASSPAEAAKQLMAAGVISKEISDTVLEEMFESPESIAKIKAADELRRAKHGEDSPQYETVEEPGDVPPTEPSASTDSNDDDDEIDPDDMDDEERLLREGRGRYYDNEDDDYNNYDDYDDY